MTRIVVLVSGGGTNLQAIMDKMDSGAITNAEIVAVRGHIKVDFIDHGRLGICKINSNYTADSASHLIHKSAGLTEKYVFGVLRDHSDLNVVDLAVIVGVVEDISNHILKCGGGRKSRALEDV